MLTDGNDEEMPADEARARELFEAYDGSTFFMSRDGADEEYRSLQVPRGIEAMWLADLTARKVASLGQPDGAMAIVFLQHHQDFTHVVEVMATQPKGNGSDQLDYLRAALGYIVEAARHGAAGEALIDHAVSVVTDRALLVAARWPAAHDQAEALIAQAAKLGSGPDSSIRTVDTRDIRER
jgi:hypothetical protein